MKIDFDDYAEGYDEILRNQHRLFVDDVDYYARYKVECVKQFLKKKPQSILEYGCGTGRNIRFLKDEFEGADIYGCDISRKSLQVAADSNKGAHFFLLDEDKIEKQFDLVFVAGVFHHVPLEERQGVMTDIARYLKKGGELFIFEQNPYNPLTRHMVKTCPFDKDARLIGPQGLKKLIIEAGLSIEFRKYTLFFPNFLKFFRRYESCLGSIPLGGQYFIYATKR